MYSTFLNITSPIVGNDGMRMFELQDRRLTNGESIQTLPGVGDAYYDHREWRVSVSYHQLNELLPRHPGLVMPAPYVPAQ